MSGKYNRTLVTTTTKLLLGYISMFTSEFQALGLAKNEAEIYERLLCDGESNASEIATRSKINRRNVYDSLNKLQDRGLVYEIRLKRESRYQAVHPSKLGDFISSKQQMLDRIMPSLEDLYNAKPPEQAVLIYRGIEGWKNYMQDILRLGEDYYCIAGKGGWMDQRLRTFFPSFIQDLARKNISCNVLFDQEVRDAGHDIVKYVGPNFRFIPKDFSTTASVEIFGDRVVLVSDLHFGGFEGDFSLTVVINEQLAEGFRNWFQLIWQSCEE